MTAPFIQLDSSDLEFQSWNASRCRPKLVLRCDSMTGPAELRKSGGLVQEFTGPLEGLRWLGRQAAILPARQRWIGFLSYDLGRLFETLPGGPAIDGGLPVYAFGLHKGNNCGGWNFYQRPCVGAMQSNFTPEQYRAAVLRALEYIRAGDVFQVNLCQRFTVPQQLPPLSTYGHLQRRSPARFGGLLDFGDLALICNSPELLLRVSPQPDGSRGIVTRPIKGTRPRQPGMAEELRDSIKDQAELNMIVDLERNDLGRVCEIGSVRVTQPRHVVAHPTVLHAEAEIAGTLREDVGLVELLAATFPGGSITGAPKIRAMQIIDELEPVRRGPYCGAIGWIGAGGAMELNVAIRTMIVRDGLVHVPVGGGIVADSDPQAEYDETLVKARAMFDALGVS
jgi:anthranilate/para-aminobenzoate synthase component I